MGEEEGEDDEEGKEGVGQHPRRVVNSMRYGSDCSFVRNSRAKGLLCMITEEKRLGLC
jgi:hypothetical protein